MCPKVFQLPFAQGSKNMKKETWRIWMIMNCLLLFCKQFSLLTTEPNLNWKLDINASKQPLHMHIWSRSLWASSETLKNAPWDAITHIKICGEPPWRLWKNSRMQHVSFCFVAPFSRNTTSPFFKFTLKNIMLLCVVKKRMVVGCLHCLKFLLWVIKMQCNVSHGTLCLMLLWVGNYFYLHYFL